MEGYKITNDQVETVLDKKFIRVFDLQYAEGRHYFDATRRDKDSIVASMDEEAFKKMLPDAVSCIVIVEEEGKEPRLLLSYEYRYPAGRFLLSVPAGLIDPEDKDKENPQIETAIREIQEETGIVVDTAVDQVSVVSPLLFSTPGMTDESNGLVLVILRQKNLNLDQTGCNGPECFDGFEFVTKEEARKILKDSVDPKGHYYSIYTWAALMYFVNDMWK
ncbi:NUDIX hydrolase [Butyrivibrio proteoclasticus]|uniref:NUDIX hydrolase n=1 Tax=Butyrivibrio proteoclasticus TaxID=43305 RepID=UPI00047AEFBA|nr:NUDIX hydrolase [Butyrivibrio proteoclasticus]